MLFIVALEPHTSVAKCMFFTGVLFKSADNAQLKCWENLFPGFRIFLVYCFDFPCQQAQNKSQNVFSHVQLSEISLLPNLFPLKSLQQKRKAVQSIW